MPVHKMKSHRFSAPTYDDWKQTAEKSLKGKPIESLQSKTIEGIELQPLYTKEHLDSLQISRVTKPHFGWTVAQRVNSVNGQDFLKQIKESLDRGNQAVTYDGISQLVWSEPDLRELAELIQQYPILYTGIDKDDPILQAFTFIAPDQRENVRGICISDVAVMPEGFPNVKDRGADLWTVHHEGADAATELAISLAMASELAGEAPSFSSFRERFYVRFPSDTHFFMEIAKYRAFRVLWKCFCEAFGERDAGQVPLLSVTSLRSFSKLDPYVNLLRSGNSAFASVLGGADWLTVLPHDVLTGSSISSNRYARNIQLILKEETHVDHVLDPSGGSYFIETLTAQLVEKAWALFLEIEDGGGYQSFLQSGELSRLYAERQKDAATGRKSLIGTNVYAELTETNFKDSPAVTVSKRLAEPFEFLRSRPEGTLPETALLNFGLLKDYKPRADFVSGFLAVGGIEPTWSPSFETIDQALIWITENQPDYAVICAPAGQAEEVITKFLNVYDGNTVLDAAGKYSEEQSTKWFADGLHGFVYAGQDKVQKLNEIARMTKGGKSGE